MAHLSPNRCSALTATSRLCGLPKLRDCPVSLCEDHAGKVYNFMLDTFPIRDVTYAEERLAFLEEAAETLRQADAEYRARHAKQSVVYYLRLHDYVKIGYTANMHARLKDLRTDAHNLMATEPGGAALEAQRHREFADERVGRRENFNPSPRLLAHIEAVRTEHGEPRVTTYIKVAS